MKKTELNISEKIKIDEILQNETYLNVYENKSTKISEKIIDDLNRCVPFLAHGLDNEYCLCLGIEAFEAIQSFELSAMIVNFTFVKRIICVDWPEESIFHEENGALLLPNDFDFYRNDKGVYQDVLMIYPV